MTTILYCATSNPGKLREFQGSAPDFDVRALPLTLAPPEENGVTFEENAIEKALAYGKHTAEYLFADDSGLEVDALRGAPGVYSARYAGPHATDAQNNQLLLERLRGAEERTARFVCVIALVREGRLVKTFRGTVDGRIIDPERGEMAAGAGGFGYDPLFYCPALSRTFGEATHDQKMQVSHRGRALQLMFTFLRNSAST